VPTKTPIHQMVCPKIVAMLAIKNEERWIAKTLESLEAICDSIVILDDGSEDNTVKICEDYKKVVEIHKNSNLPTDKSRDKNILLEMAKKSNPDYILTLDGDEVIIPNSKDIFFEEINVLYPESDVFEFEFLYIWDKPNQYRYDGYYCQAWHKRLLKMKNQPEDLHYSETGYVGNGHSPGVPQNCIGQDKPIRSKVKILHYGYFDDELRQNKFKYYTARDADRISKHNEFGGYKNIISGEGKLSGPHGMEFRYLPEGFYFNFPDKKNPN